MKIEEIRALAAIVRENGLTRLEVAEGDTRVTLELGGAAAASGAAMPVPTVPAVETPDRGYLQRSPVVGTVYLAPEPGAAPLVDVGDRVEAGQRLCILEAMKLFTDMTAEKSGVIAAVLVENGQAVGVGDALFEIRED